VGGGCAIWLLFLLSTRSANERNFAGKATRWLALDERFGTVLRTSGISQEKQPDGLH